MSKKVPKITKEKKFLLYKKGEEKIYTTLGRTKSCGIMRKSAKGKWYSASQLLKKLDEEAKARIKKRLKIEKCQRKLKENKKTAKPKVKRPATKSKKLPKHSATPGKVKIGIVPHAFVDNRPECEEDENQPVEVGGSCFDSVYGRRIRNLRKHRGDEWLFTIGKGSDVDNNHRPYFDNLEMILDGGAEEFATCLSRGRQCKYDPESSMILEGLQEEIQDYIYDLRDARNYEQMEKAMGKDARDYEDLISVLLDPFPPQDHIAQHLGDGAAEQFRENLEAIEAMGFIEDFDSRRSSGDKKRLVPKTTLKRLLAVAQVVADGGGDITATMTLARQIGLVGKKKKPSMITNKKKK